MEIDMAISSKIIKGKKLYEVYVNGFDLRGRRIQRRKRRIESIRKAEEIEFGFESELAKLREEGSPQTWAEWIEIVIKRMRQDCAASTVINYESYLGKWVNNRWKNKELRSINRDDVYKAVFEDFDQTLAANSKKTLLKQIRRVFQMAVDDGILDRNPTAGIKVPVPETDPQVLTNEEAKIFLQQAKILGHRFYPIWLMALFTGMRSGELFALEWTDIDLEAKLISVTKQWTNKCGITPTKTRRNRVVPISDELMRFLREYKLRRPGNELLPKLTEWENGEQAQVTREFCMSIGITSIKFHDLRATFITNLLSRGVALGVVMSIVGHTQIKTTNVYFRKAGVDVRGGTDGLGYTVPIERQAALLQIVT
jgi:integrase